MAKKSAKRMRPPRQGPQASQRSTTFLQRYRKLVVGGLILVVVVGIGVMVRTIQQRSIPPLLQGAVDNHYTRGAAAAPVVIKEFSDYT